METFEYCGRRLKHIDLDEAFALAKKHCETEETVVKIELAGNGVWTCLYLQEPESMGSLNSLMREVVLNPEAEA
jgi:hypothetical protein